MASANGFELSAGVRQMQTLAPQLQEALRLLQMNTVDLAAAVRAEIDRNAVLEVPDDNTPTLSAVEAREKARDEIRAEEGPEDEAAPSVSYDEDAAERRQRLFDRQVKTETLQDHLIAQIALSDIAPADGELARTLIGCIDDDGRFTGSFADIEMVTGADAKKVNAVLRRILKFDPLGCGARDLRECLIAQLEKLDDDPWQNEVRKIVLRHLEDVAAGRTAEVAAALGITAEELAKALASLRTLDPRPGRAFASPDDPRYVTPEVHAVLRDGRWMAETDDRGVPDIRISPRYVRMLEDAKTTPETKAFIRERIRAAEAFREAVERRQDTIRNIAQAIFDAQPGFFANGLAGLNPLTMQEIADKTGVHSTTVSRTVRGKYAATPHGTVELRRFFVQGVATTGAGGTVSRKSVEERIREIVAGEDKAQPLSDDRIAALLKNEGIDIARRTVAKYRKLLGIPGTAARK